jgi:hypothetical protein
MTSPEDAAATSRDPSAMILYAASDLEALAREDRAEYGPVNLWTTVPPPVPVPMGEPIEDVTIPRDVGHSPAKVEGT